MSKTYTLTASELRALIIAAIAAFEGKDSVYNFNSQGSDLAGIVADEVLEDYDQAIPEDNVSAVEWGLQEEF